MPEIRPFRALRYNIARAGNPANLVAVAPDLLSDERRQELRERSPYNIVNLMAQAQPDGRVLLCEWLERRVLQVDDKPSLYVYEQTYGSDTGRTVHRAVLGLLRLEAGDSKVKVPGRPENRTEALTTIRSTDANLAPVLALYDDPKGEVDGILAAARSALPELALTDDMGIEHRLFPVPSPYDLRRVIGLLERKRFILGDGEGIYEAAKLHQTTERSSDSKVSSGDRPYDFVMTSFSNFRDPGLSVLPYHRVIDGLSGFEFGPFLKRLSERFDLEQVRSLRDQVGMMIKLEEACRDGQAMIILGGGAVGRRAGYIARLKREAAVERLAGEPGGAATKALDVFAFNVLILKDLLGCGVSHALPTPGVHYVSQLERATQMGRAKTTQLVVLLNPPSIAAVSRVAEAGEHLPYRTAHYFPPTVAGLTIHSLSGF